MTEVPLGQFYRVVDQRRAARGALRYGLGAFALIGIVAGVGRAWLFLIAALLAGVAVYYGARRLLLRRLTPGQVMLRSAGKRRLLVLLYDGRILHRVPLDRARARGRKQLLPSVGEVRLQISLGWPQEIRPATASDDGLDEPSDAGALIANLAVGYKPAADDQHGLLAASIELDRAASRAFDALSYELPAA